MSEDIYSPEYKRRERTGATKTMSESTSYIGKGETDLEAILNRLVREFGNRALWFQLKEPFPIPNCFDEANRQVVYWPDVIVHGSRFGDGIFRVQGGIHRTKKHQRRDPIQKQRMEEQRYWVEDLSESEAKQESVIRERLELHRRRTDSYGGVL